MALANSDYVSEANTVCDIDIHANNLFRAIVYITTKINYITLSYDIL